MTVMYVCHLCVCVWLQAAARSAELAGVRLRLQASEAECQGLQHLLKASQHKCGGLEAEVRHASPSCIHSLAAGA
jgi:hypothetical protein